MMRDMGEKLEDGIRFDDTIKKSLDALGQYIDFDKLDHSLNYILRVSLMDNIEEMSNAQDRAR